MSGTQKRKKTRSEANFFLAQIVDPRSQSVTVVRGDYKD